MKSGIKKCQFATLVRTVVGIGMGSGHQNANPTLKQTWANPREHVISITLHYIVRGSVAEPKKLRRTDPTKKKKKA